MTYTYELYLTTKSASDLEGAVTVLATHADDLIQTDTGAAIELVTE